MKHYKIKGLLAGNGMTQKDLGNMLGITGAAVNEKINGRRAFTLSEALKMSQFFGVSVNDIFLRGESTQNKS